MQQQLETKSFEKITLEGTSNQEIKTEILRLAKQSYEYVSKNWKGDTCFHCMLLENFCNGLIHLHCNQITSILQKKISNFLLDKQQQNVSECNSFCFNFEALQWKNNQKSAVLAILDNILRMMMKSQCNSLNAQRQDVLLNLDQQIHCPCNKCQKTQKSLSNKRINGANTDTCFEEGFQSLRKIQQCLKQKREVKIQQNKLQHIFDLLRHERKQNHYSKLHKKQKQNLLYNLYGTLLQLQKQKHCDENQELQTRKNKIYSQLLKKNEFNQRQIKKFNLKINSKKSQQKIAKKSPTIQDSLSTIDCSRSSHKKQKHQVSIKTTPLISSRLLHFVANKETVKKSDKLLRPIPNIQETILNYSRLQKSVDKALKNLQSHEQKRETILKSVLFNANELFTNDKHVKLRPVLNRPYFCHFEKVLKSSHENTGLSFRKSFQLGKKMLNTANS